jgi:hypothetical protein
MFETTVRNATSPLGSLKGLLCSFEARRIVTEIGVLFEERFDL